MGEAPKKQGGNTTPSQNVTGPRRAYMRPETEVVEAGATERGYTSAQAKALLGKEEQIRRNKDESVHFFDENGNEKFSKKGRRNEVNLTDEMRRGILPKNSIITHNHPLALGKTGVEAIGSSFSPQDIDLAIKTDAREMRAKTPTYTFSLKRPRGGWGVTPREFAEAVNREHAKIHRQDTNYVYKGKSWQDVTSRDSRQAITHWHRVVRQMARKYGWDYTKKKG